MLNTVSPTKKTPERILIETSVQCVPLFGEPLSSLCSDLSVGGMYLKTEYILENHENIALSFSIPFKDHEIAITCKARVAWTNYESGRQKPDYPPGAGLEFLSLSSNDSSTLSTFIDTYEEYNKMNIVCAWCEKDLGLRKGPSGMTSHGICGQCKEKHF